MMNKTNETKGTEKCTVLKNPLTIDEAKCLLDSQRGNVTPNQRNGEESAFEKALIGSKRYLKHNGLI